MVAVPPHPRRQVVETLDGVTLGDLRSWASLAE
jgi:hypothetical protein